MKHFNDYHALARQILELVGGPSNVISVNHCQTRLRFVLRNEALADTEALQQLDGVLTVVRRGGQYMVVVGSQVPQVYATLMESGLSAALPVQVPPGKAFLSTITGVFGPILGVMSATGILKGVLLLLASLGLMNTDGGAWRVLYGLADSLFYFLPVLLGYTAALHFDLDPFVGLLLGLTLCYPDLTQLGDGIQFLGMPIQLPSSGSYTTSVLPVLFAVWFASKLAKLLAPRLPDTIRSFTLPLATLLVTVPATFLVIGPVSAGLSEFLAQWLEWLYHLSPAAAGTAIGGLWQLMVMFGLHWTATPLTISHYSTLGYDFLLPAMYGTTFAQTAAAAAVCLKTRDKHTRRLGAAAVFSGLAGITEPAMYGITLPRRLPFTLSCVGAAITGGYLGWAGVYSYQISGQGVFGLTGYIDPATGSLAGMGQALIGVGLGMAFAFVSTLFLYHEPNKEQPADRELLASPMAGQLLPLEQVADGAFSAGVLGPGCAIRPSEGRVAAPAAGRVLNLSPTGHAIGLACDNGAEVLIHVGLDTARAGHAFQLHVEEGQQVLPGQLLMEFDLAALTARGLDLTTPVVVTNSEAFDRVVCAAEAGANVALSAPLLRLIPKSGQNCPEPG